MENNFDMLLSQIINTFRNNASSLLINKLNISILDNIKISNNKDSIWSLCKYNRISDSMIEITPIKPISIKIICAALYSYKLDLNIEQGDKFIKVSLPSVTIQRRKISLCELSRIFENNKINLRKLRREAINKIKLMKYICDDKRLQLLKHIDSSMTRALTLLNETYSQNKNRLSS